MRSRRPAATLAASLLLALPAALTVLAPAVADTPSYADLPSGWSFDWVPMASPEYGSAGYTAHVDGDAAPGLGSGALLVQLGPVTQGNLSIPQPLDGLTAAGVWISPPATQLPPASIQLLVTLSAGTYTGSVAVPAEGVWNRVDLGTLPLSGPSSTTLVDLAAGSTEIAGLTLRVVNTYDAGGARLLVDGWSTTRKGVADTIDFEGPHAETACTIATSRSRIVAGRSATVSTMLTQVSDAAPLAGRSLALLAQPYGAASPSPVANATTGASGSASRKVSPTRRTTYRWTLPQNAVDGRCESGAVRVDVATKVAAKVAHSTVARGSALVVSGTTTPAKPGARVTVWRKTAGGNVKLASGKVRPGGIFRLSKTASSRGRWKVFVTVAKSSGNLAGTSPTRSVRVS